jgi:hypothetical protein
MISPRLSILMVAMSVVGTVAPMTAMAQDSESEAESFLGNVADQVNAAETGGNTQVIVQDQKNTQSNTVAVVADRGGEAELEADDIDQENEAELTQTATNNLDDRDEVEQENEADQEIEDSNSIAAAFRDLNLGL